MRRKKSPYKRRYKIRSRKFYNKRWFWNFILSLLFLLSFAWLLFKTDYFQIKEITIVGEKKLSNSIQGVLGENLNFFLFNSSYISQKIRESFPKIGEIQIQKKFPNSVLITIIEKKAIGVVCSKEKLDKCFLLASDGTILGRARREKNLLKFLILSGEEIRIGDTVIEKNIMEDFIFLQEDLKNIKISIKEVEVFLHELIIKTGNGFKIYFSKDNNFRFQAEVLINVLRKTISENERKELKYIDLRGIGQDGEGEVYFK